MLDLIGRGERIRTSDLTVPNRALYQAEPRPDMVGMIGKRRGRCQTRFTLACFRRVLRGSSSMFVGFSRNGIVSINCLPVRLQDDVTFAARGCDRDGDGIEKDVARLDLLQNEPQIASAEATATSIHTADDRCRTPSA